MPTYEYKCKKCKDNFEVFQGINDEPLTKCIVCGGKVNKVFHPVGIVFKGSGFYTTDYKNKESKPAKSNPKPKKEEKKPCENKGNCAAAGTNC